MTKTIKIGDMELTVAEARKAGLLPEQRKARAGRQFDLLKRNGLQRTDMGHALRRLAKAVR